MFSWVVKKSLRNYNWIAHTLFTRNAELRQYDIFYRQALICTMILFYNSDWIFSHIIFHSHLYGQWKKDRRKIIRHIHHRRHSFDISFLMVFILSRENDAHNKFFSGRNKWNKVDLLRGLTVHPWNPQQFGEKHFVLLLCNFVPQQYAQKTLDTSLVWPLL